MVGGRGTVVAAAFLEVGRVMHCSDIWERP